MEYREWATRILSAETLEEKLLDPDELTDHHPGPALFWKEPARPAHMGFHPHHCRKDRLPSLAELKHPDKRAACLHRFAGHELLAVEIMAYALLAFPEAPSHFRRGVAHTLREEQEHVRLYMQRMQGLGISFGDLPLYRHFWSYVHNLTSPIHYVSVMSLTFEMANLDFAPIYGATFTEHGDLDSAALMDRILNDEIRHVSFGWRWLSKLKSPSLSSWDAWEHSLPPRMTPARARAKIFHPEHRLKAGIPEEWILKLNNY